LGGGGRGRAPGPGPSLAAAGGGGRVQPGRSPARLRVVPGGKL